MSAAAEAPAERPLPGLPSGWVWARLGDICEAINGRAFKSSEWRESGLPIIRIQNLKDPDAEFNYFSGELDERHRVRHGDLLFAWSGTPGTSFGAHIWKGPDAALNQHIFNMKFDPTILDSRYLCLALNQNVSRYVAQAQGGVGLAHITKSKFLDSFIPLAPKAKQLELVAEIEKQFSRLDEAVANLKRVKANLLAFKQTKVREAVWGDRLAEPFAVNLPAGWSKATLSELGEFGRGKSKHRPRDDSRLYGGPYPFIQTGDVRRSGGVIRKFTQTYSEFGLQQSRLWPAGTLCITIAANIAETGILAMPACFPDSVVGFVCEDETIVQYVELFFRTIRVNLERYAPATAQKNINLSVLERIQVPLPPASKRKQIVTEVDRRLSIVQEVDDEVARNLARAEALRGTVLRSAFAT